jgi:hypothetical protein
MVENWLPKAGPAGSRGARIGSQSTVNGVAVLACFDHEVPMKRPNKPANSAANERNQRQYGGLVKWRTISSAYPSTPLSRFKK